MGDFLLGLATGGVLGITISLITWIGLGNRTTHWRDAIARIGDNPHDDNGQS